VRNRQYEELSGRAACASSKSMAAAGTPASCTTPVEQDMVVHTQTPHLQKLRRGVMELYISDHPLDCLTCAANGDCELQDQAGAVGLRDVRYEVQSTHLGQEKDHSNPYFDFDPSKCIACSRCIRACDEVQGTLALTMEGRGWDSKISAGLASDNFLGSECVSCGACVQACPTATLVEKKVVEIGTPERSVVTTCAYCGVGCTFRAEMRGEQLVRMVPYKDGKANRGHSCVKGRFAWGYAQHQDRILKPMIRKSSKTPGVRSSGMRHLPIRRPNLSAFRTPMAAMPWAELPPAAAPMKKLSWSRNWSAPGSETTMSIPAPASAIRLPAMD
jgi:formate dehydrogenase major subunit